MPLLRGALILDRVGQLAVPVPGASGGLTVADVRRDFSIDPWSILLDARGNVVADAAPLDQLGSKLVEYQRLAFDLVNPHAADVVLRPHADAEVGLQPFTHEHPGLPGVSGAVVIADPGCNDGGPCATVFGDVAVTAGRWAWEVDVLTDGDFAIGLASVEESRGQGADAWPCCLDARGRGAGRRSPLLFPGGRPLGAVASSVWAACESQASARGGIPARHSRPESLSGSRITMWLDTLSSPPRAGFALQGDRLGGVALPQLDLGASPVYPALQLEWDDLCALRIVPYEGPASLSKEQLATLGAFLHGLLDLEHLWPITLQGLASHAAAHQTEDELSAAGELAAWTVFEERGDEHIPRRCDAEGLDAFALRVMEMILMAHE